MRKEDLIKVNPKSCCFSLYVRGINVIVTANIAMPKSAMRNRETVSILSQKLLNVGRDTTVTLVVMKSTWLSQFSQRSIPSFRLD